MSGKNNTNVAFRKKWGAAVESAGFTQIPNVLIHGPKGLGINTTQFAILVLLLSYEWNTKESRSSPAKERLAESLGLTSDAVRKNIQALEKKGYVTRVYRKGENGRNQSNVYEFSGLRVALAQRAAFEAAGKAADARDRQKRKARYRTEPTQNLGLNGADLAKLPADVREDLETVLAEKPS